MSNIWFSSDWHFNHKNIAGPTISSWKKGFRNFLSIQEMNETITNSLNRHVDADDILYFLGDFAFGNKKLIPSLREQINCKRICLIYGNHDQAIRQSGDFKRCFEWCRDYYELYSHNTIFCMTHYAPLVWNESHHGSFALWGHSHGTLPDRGLRSLDVGVDTAHFGEAFVPYHIDDIYDHLKTRPPTAIDHHTAETT